MRKNKAVGKSHVTRTSWKPGVSGNPAGRPRKAPPEDIYAAQQGRRNGSKVGRLTGVPTEASALPTMRAELNGAHTEEKTWFNRLTRQTIRSQAMPVGCGWLKVGPDGPIDDLAFDLRSSCAWREGGAAASPEPQREKPYDWLRDNLERNSERTLRRGSR
jgi:hypothetical protein